MIASTRLRVSLGFIAVLFFQTSCGGWDPAVKKGSGENGRPDVQKTIDTMLVRDPDLQRFFDNAYGYAVYPTVGKGAIGIGGAHGKGEVFAKGHRIGRSSVTQLTIGLQLGGQAYSEIIFFKDKDTLEDFKNGNFELSAQASAVAITAGASKDASYDHGVAVFTMTKGGLMYEASIGGQKFSFDPR